MLEQAIKFIGEGKFPQAKELLTNLLQTNQNNATYWVWMSAAMETQKERLYCLQMAYKADPANAAARRGLVLLGALNPDDAQMPFPMNHPRPWESKLKLDEEKDKPKGIKRVTSNPFFRLAAIGVVVVAVVGGAIFGLGAFINRNRPVTRVNLTPPTPRPTVTVYVNKNVPTLDATIVPLESLRKDIGTLTPTAIYALTPHGDAASDAYRGAIRAYSQGNWSEVESMMAQVATTQPGSVDTIYFMAEAKRLGGQYQDALEYYKAAIKVNANFAPIYLGRARADLGINPRKSVLLDLDKAIKLDPNFAEAYLERGLYSLGRENLPAAKSDLVQAASMNPNSPLIQLSLARVLLALGENKAALEAAEKAKELDVAMLDVYLVLGMAYQANGQTDQTVEVLDIYTRYSLTNTQAFTILAAAYFNRGDYTLALKNADQAILLDRNNSQAYRWRGEIYLATEESKKALSDFRQSYRTHITFEAGIGIARALLESDESEAPRLAYNSIIEIEKLLKTDQQKGISFYYRALALEKLNEQVAASRDWASLLRLPETATTEQMRADAKAHITSLQSATPPPPSATITRTPTRTSTLTPALTLTPTPKK